MKTYFAALTLSTLSALSFADATQFDIPNGNRSRAEVIAAITVPSAAMQIGDATVFANPTGTALSRMQVMADAQAARAGSRNHGESNAQRFAVAPAAQSSAQMMADAQSKRTDQFGDANRSDINQLYLR